MSIRILVLSFNAALIASLTGCGGSSNPTPTSSGPTASASTASAPAASSSAPASPALAEASASAPAPSGRVVGGPCTYTDDPGTCTITPDGKFTFKGSLEGTAVELKNNTLSASDKAPPVGSSAPCSMRRITGGTCTPCGFSIGSCGPAAWDAFRSHAKK